MNGQDYKIKEKIENKIHVLLQFMKVWKIHYQFDSNLRKICEGDKFIG